MIETGVDIGLGAAATAGVSAAAVALGVTAAPAIVIGGVATVAVWGANSLCKWATGGKNIAETVSDAVCDVGEKAYALGKSAVNAVSEKWNSVTSWAKNAFAF